MILKILIHISVFREIIDYIRDKGIQSKKLILLGNDTIERKLFGILLKVYHLKYQCCTNYDFFVKWFKNKANEQYFYIIVDKEYDKWLSIINKSGEMTNFAVPYVK